MKSLSDLYVKDEYHYCEGRWLVGARVDCKLGHPVKLRRDTEPHRGTVPDMESSGGQTRSFGKGVG